jgi:hypothetical protein
MQQLLSVTDAACDEEFRSVLPANLCTAPSASLFILSRRALAEAVRAEAEKVLSARLHEGEAPEAPPAEAVNSDTLPPEYATHRHFYKFCEGQRWVLTTRSGLRITAFDTEADLDQWWRRLKKQRGRILTRVQRDGERG